MIAIMGDLKDQLVHGQELVEQFDQQQYAALRGKGLLQREYPLTKSPPRALRKDAASRIGAAVASSLVASKDIMHDVERDNLIRSGNLTIGSAPADFRKTEEGVDPHYLAQIKAGQVRAETNAVRFTTTVGGFGPAFHRTGQLGLVDIPTTSGKSGQNVSIRNTLASPRSSAIPGGGPNSARGIQATSAMSRGGSSASSARPAGTAASSSAAAGARRPPIAGGQKQLKRGISFREPSDVNGAAPRSDEDAFDAEIARSTTADEPYAAAVYQDPDTNALALNLERMASNNNNAPTSANIVSGTAGMTAAQRRAAAASSILDGVPDGIPGTRGEGLSGFLARQGTLNYARKNAGAGTVGALSLQDISSNAAVEDRMQRPQGFLKNPRHLKAKKSSLLLTGAGTGKKAVHGALPDLPLQTIPPGTVSVSPPRQRRTESSGAAAAADGQQAQHVVFQTVGATGAVESSPRTARSGTIGIAAALGNKTKSAFLQSKGAPIGSTLIREQGLAVVSESFAGTFVVRPATLDFKNYDAGATINATVTIQNVDSVSRHVRILPPATRVFQMESPAFPGASGAGGLTTGSGVPGTMSSSAAATSAVAPGMAVKISVSFVPPAAAPYNDEITLVTEGGTFTIPLRATLPSPELTLPLHLSAGVALRHDVNRMVLPITNIGARAHFRILPSEIFELAPASALSLGDSLLPGGVRELPDDVYLTPSRCFFGPFALSPSSFELGQNETAELTLLFAPSAMGAVDRSFVVVTSEGSVYTHTIDGDCCDLQVGISGLQAAPVPSPPLTGVDRALPITAAERKAAQAPATAPGSIPGSLAHAIASALTKAMSAPVAQTDDQQQYVGIGSDNRDADAAAIAISVANPPSRLLFPDTHAGSRCTRTVTVRNDTAVPIRYSWSTEAWDRMAPQLPMPSWEEEDTAAQVRKSRSVTSAVTAPESRYHPEGPTDIVPKPAPPPYQPFVISPAQGYLAPSGDTTFTVTFAPDSHASCDAVAFIDVHDVPRDPKVHAEQQQRAARLELTQIDEVAGHDGGGVLSITNPAAAKRRASKPGEYSPEPTPRAATPAAALAAASAAEVFPSASSGEYAHSEEKKDEDLPLHAWRDDHHLSLATADWNGSDREGMGSRGDGHSVVNVSVAHAADSIVHRTSVTVGRLVLHGSGKRADVVADPPAATLPGPLLPGQAAVQPVRLVNKGDAPVHFEFPSGALHGSALSGFSGGSCSGPSAPSSSFAASPSMGMIPAGGEAIVSVTFSSADPGIYTVDLPCNIYHPLVDTRDGSGSTNGDQSIHGPLSGTLHIRSTGSVKCPEVRFAEPVLDVGLVGCARTMTTKVKVVNVSDCAANWTIARVRGPGSPLDAHKQSLVSDSTAIISGDDATGASEVQPLDLDSSTCNMGFEPAFGQLPPHSEVEVTVTIETGGTPERLRAYLRAAVVPILPSSPLTEVVHAKGHITTHELPIDWKDLPSSLWSPPSYMRLIGEVQSPRVSLSYHELSLGVVFLGVPLRHSITLTNECNLDVKYKWDPYVGALQPAVMGGRGASAASSATSAPSTASGGQKRAKRSSAVRAQQSKFELSFTPANGVLAPREKLTIHLTFIPRAVGVVDKSLFACDVKGMQYPLGCTVNMLVKGVTVAYALVDDATGCVIPMPPQPPAMKPAAIKATPAPAPASGAVSASASVVLEDGSVVDAASDAHAQHRENAKPSTAQKSMSKAAAALVGTALAERLSSGGEESSDLDSNFGSSLAAMDPLLRNDPVVKAIEDAYERAGEIGASIGRIPDIAFGSADAPLGLMDRRSLSLHILNLSGIPTGFTMSAQHFGAYEQNNGNNNGSGSGETNWPALYYAVDGIAGPRAAQLKGTSAVGSGAAAVKAAVAAATASGGSADVVSGNQVEARSESPPADGGKQASPVEQPQLKQVKVDRVKRYGQQVVKRIGEDPETTLRRTELSALSSLSGVQYNSGGDTTSGAPLTTGRRSEAATSKSRQHADGGHSPTRARPTWFLSDAGEPTSRFASLGGRGHMATQEGHKVMRQSLGNANGCSVEIFPRSCILPPFGQVAVQIGCVADMPGVYEDVMKIVMEGVPDLQVPIKAHIAGNPLALVQTTVGLQPNGACGSDSPTVNFGDQAINGPLQTKVVHVENNGPLDAHLVWHVSHDRAPGAPHRPLAIDIDVLELIGGGGDGADKADATGADGKEGDVSDAAAVNDSLNSSVLSVSVRPFSDRVDVPARPTSATRAAGPPPFSIAPNVMMIPAYGRSSIRITATPTPITPSNKAMAVEMGWKGEDLLKFARARFTADAVFVTAGDMPPRNLLELAERPYTPGEGSTGTASNEQPGDNSAEGTTVGAGNSGVSIDGDSAILDATTAPPPNLPLTQSGPSLLREALCVKAVVRPFQPLLQIDKAVLGDGRPYVTFHVWSLAMEGSKGLGSMSASIVPQLSAGASGTALASRNSARGGPGLAASGAVTGALPLTSPNGANASNILHPSCRKSFALTNAAGSDLVFTARAEGPFLLVGAHTTAPKHPITRMDVLHQHGKIGKSPSSATQQPGSDALSSTQQLSASLASLFAPGALAAGPDGSIPRIYSLPPQTNLTIDIAFDPGAGNSLKANAAALFFTNGADGSSGKGSAAVNALTSTVRAADGALGSGTVSLMSKDGTLRLGSTTTDPLSSTVGPSPVAPAPQGTITLGATGGIKGSDVDAVIGASVTRLKGDYIGRLVITFSNGSVQEIGLRAEVIRPAVTAAPSAHTFGVVRVQSQSVTTVHLGNPTAVDAHWALRHVPAPPGRPPRAAENVDWRSLGLQEDPLWSKPPSDPANQPVDDPSVFAFSNISGLIPGPTAPLEMALGKPLRQSTGIPQALPLQVAFAPKAAVLYQCRYRVSVRQGESFEIVLRGRGTFEEQ